MPCGVETTNKIVEILQQSSKPLSILDICRIIGRTREIVRDGLSNIRDIGYQLDVKEVHVPTRRGRPEYVYSLRAENPSAYAGPNVHRVQSFGRL